MKIAAALVIGMALSACTPKKHQAPHAEIAATKPPGEQANPISPESPPTLTTTMEASRAPTPAGSTVIQQCVINGQRVFDNTGRLCHGGNGTDKVITVQNRADARPATRFTATPTYTYSERFQDSMEPTPCSDRKKTELERRIRSLDSLARQRSTERIRNDRREVAEALGDCIRARNHAGN